MKQKTVKVMVAIKVKDDKFNLDDTDGDKEIGNMIASHIEDLISWNTEISGNTEIKVDYYGTENIW